LTNYSDNFSNQKNVYSVCTHDLANKSRCLTVMKRFGLVNKKRINVTCH